MPLPPPPPLPETPEEKALLSVISDADNAHHVLAEVTARTLAKFWCPKEYTTAQILTRASTNAVKYFEAANNAISFFEADEFAQPVFIEQCKKWGVTVIVNSEHSLSFPQILPTEFHPDGTVTLK